MKTSVENTLSFSADEVKDSVNYMPVNKIKYVWHGDTWDIITGIIITTHKLTNLKGVSYVVNAIRLGLAPRKCKFSIRPIGLSCRCNMLRFHSSHQKLWSGNWLICKDFGNYKDFT